MSDVDIHSITLGGKIRDYKLAIQNEGMGDVARIPYVTLRIAANDNPDHIENLNLVLGDVKRLLEARSSELDPHNVKMLRQVQHDSMDPAFQHRMKFPV